MRRIFKSIPKVRDGLEQQIKYLYVFEFDNDEERQRFEDKSHNEKCEFFGVSDEAGTFVEPGALFWSYYFSIEDDWLIMIETSAYNV